MMILPLRPKISLNSVKTKKGWAYNCPIYEVGSPSRIDLIVR